MEKYKIEIKETLVREVIIDASSIDEALNIASRLYNNEQLVLDYNDHKTTDIDICNLNLFIEDTNFVSFISSSAEKSLVNLSTEELAKLGFGNLNEAIKEFLKKKNNVE